MESGKLDSLISQKYITPLTASDLEVIPLYPENPEQKAILDGICQMLAQGDLPITAIGQACGLGSTSYFGKTFQCHLGCTPSDYRKKWQDRHNK